MMKKPNKKEMPILFQILASLKLELYGKFLFSHYKLLARLGLVT